jgi:hypothetical protein
MILNNLSYLELIQKSIFKECLLIKGSDQSVLKYPKLKTLFPSLLYERSELYSIRIR